MPNKKKGHTGKCGNSMVPVKVVLTFERCQKCAVKIARHKRAAKCVILPRQKRVDLFAQTTAHNYICFSVELMHTSGQNTYYYMAILKMNSV